MSGQPGFLPGERLWTPWRMAYVGGERPDPGCVFCQAAHGSNDTASLVVYRGEHCFAIMNLYPYNTGHLMIVPYAHVQELAALTPAARAELAELTSSFCTGLREVMGCDGFNTGMNLGSAAGAGIADHLHQHIVPRWIGDANFMPLVGGTKVLPELIPATYAKVRLEVERQRNTADEFLLVVVTPTGEVLLAGDRLPSVRLGSAGAAWMQAGVVLRELCERFEIIGWAGAATAEGAGSAPMGLAVRGTPLTRSNALCTEVSIDEAATRLPSADHEVLDTALSRFGNLAIGPGS